VQTITFQGLGTYWSIELDAGQVPVGLDVAIKNKAQSFEEQYSRFLPDSEISQINASLGRRISISRDLKLMLELGQEVRELTNGRFDLNISHLLEGYGYDKNYSFLKNEAVLNRKPGNWWISGDELVTSGPVQLDLGSLGKGYLIDLLAEILTSFGENCYLVEGGGDILATTKADGSSWRVAIEHPLNNYEAVATLELSNAAVCSSSPKRRQIGRFHHLLNPQTREPISELAAVSVVADRAFIADACSTAFFVCPDVLRPKLTEKYGIKSLVIKPDLSYEADGPFNFFSPM
jgi:thiamine biosynthesis lipoprotein